MCEQGNLSPFYKKGDGGHNTDMDSDLRNNNFPIRPYYKSERDYACEYCSYKDVCFVRLKEQANVLSKEEKEDE